MSHKKHARLIRVIGRQMRKLVVCDDIFKVISDSALLATCSPQERGGGAAESQQWSRAASVLGQVLRTSFSPTGICHCWPEVGCTKRM